MVHFLLRLVMGAALADTQLGQESKRKNLSSRGPARKPRWVACPVVQHCPAEVVAPIGQAMLCDLVPEAERGWVFGLLQSISTALNLS